MATVSGCQCRWQLQETNILDGQRHGDVCYGASMDWRAYKSGHDLIGASRPTGSAGRSFPGCIFERRSAVTWLAFIQRRSRCQSPKSTSALHLSDPQDEPKLSHWCLSFFSKWQKLHDAISFRVLMIFFFIFWRRSILVHFYVIAKRSVTEKPAMVSAKGWSRWGVFGSCVVLAHTSRKWGLETRLKITKGYKECNAQRVDTVAFLASTRSLAYKNEEKKGGGVMFNWQIRYTYNKNKTAERYLFQVKLQLPGQIYLLHFLYIYKVLLR